MDQENISLIAQLIKDYGLFRVVSAMLLAGFSVAFPIGISFLKDISKRKDDKKLYSILSTLGEDIRTIASQYADSLSKQMVEILLEAVYRREYWIMYDFVRAVIEKNDVDNDRHGIEDRVRMQTKLAFKSITNDLMKFRYKGRIVSDFLACGTWETEISETVVKAIFTVKGLPTEKKVANMRAYLDTEFGNIHFLTMQNITSF